LQDTTLELNFGRRYGLIGRTGVGKSTFLKAVASGDLALPDHIDRYLLNCEAEPSDQTAMEAVLDWARVEVTRLNKLEEHLLEVHGSLLRIDSLASPVAFARRL
jgi:ATP-binding cassette subfamily F protein 2